MDASPHPNVPVKPASSTSRGLAQGIGIGLLGLGLQFWLLTDQALVRTPLALAVYAAAVLVAFAPGLPRLVGRFDRRLSAARSSPVLSLALLASVTLIAGIALYGMARYSDRPFVPIVHDEFSYILQARMIAEGHLWLPAHPLSEFFDTFYVITDRVYASQYFPGSALMFAAGVWMNASFWLMPLVVSAAAAGAIFLLMRELFRTSVAFAAVVVVFGVVAFRFVSISALSQSPALLLEALMFWALLRWDRTRRMTWIAIASIAFGWLGITRPLEAAIFGACGGLFVLWQLRRERRVHVWVRIAAVGLIPILPFLAVQIVLNRGVTGDWLTTPFSYYADRDMPGTGYGFHTFDPTAKPQSEVVQKQAFYNGQVRAAVVRHNPRGVLENWRDKRLVFAVTEVLPDPLLLIVVPIGAFALRDARRVMIAATMPLWWVFYSLHPFTFFHYYVVLIPAMCVYVFAGFEAMSRLWPRLSRPMRVLQVTLPIAVVVMVLPIMRKDVIDQVVNNPAEVFLRSQIGTIAEPRAIVLVRFGETSVPEHEVVYNIDRAWPDDNSIVRAHDLGEERNSRLFAYFAQHQPDRVVYRYDRERGSFERLGNVAELAGGATTRPEMRRMRDNVTPSGTTQ